VKRIALRPVRHRHHSYLRSYLRFAASTAYNPSQDTPLCRGL
jgi:hypothetical protein